MRKADVAEALLSLVGSPERARSFVGDLMEERGHGVLWFWRSVTRLWLAMLGRDVMTAPATMAIGCTIAWFVYMLFSAVLALIGYVVVTLAWGIAYVLNNHTGLELLTDLMRVRFDRRRFLTWRSIRFKPWPCSRSLHFKSAAAARGAGEGMR